MNQPSIPPRDRLSLRRRRLAAALLAGAILAPAARCEPSGREDGVGSARFFVETVRVEGGRRVPPEVVLSESRLEPGRTYSEDEILAAVDRVRRLPFVLDASPALERGGGRGRLRLVIRVEELERFFFAGEALVTRFGRDLTLDDSLPQDGTTRAAPLVGARFFAGRYAVAFAAVGDGPAVRAGYARYRLFGRPAILELDYRRDDGRAVDVPPLGLDPAFGSWTNDGTAEEATLTLGVPLGSGDRSLRLVASIREGDGGERRPVIGEPSEILHPHDGSSDRRLELQWVADTRDDALFPTRGSRLILALERRSFAADLAGDLHGDGLRSRLLRAAVTGERAWPLRGRHALAATVRLAAGRSEVENVPLAGAGPEIPRLAAGELDAVEVSASLRHHLRLWESRRDRPAQELLWENVVALGHEEVSPALDLPHNPLRRFAFTSALTWRSVWGIFRLGIAYVDAGRSL